MGEWNVKVGTQLSITLKQQINLAETITYRSKIIDRTEKELMIDYPVDIGQYVNLPILPEQTINIEYLKKGNVFTFNAKVKRINRSPILSFVIDIPEQGTIQKIQRREYVRINTDVNIAVHSLHQSFEPFSTVTQDISGGGAAIITPHHLTLNQGELVLLYIVLKSSYSDFEYIKTKAEIIRTMTLNEVRSTSVKFDFFDERDRQKIIKFCFEIQREKLKKQVF